MSNNKNMLGNNGNRFRRLESLLVALLTIVMVEGVMWTTRANGSLTRRDPEGVTVHGKMPATAALPAAGFAPIVKAALPAVVSITSSKTVKVNENDFPFFNDPLFGRRLPQIPNSKPREERMRGLGSGVIISTDGLILTNNHVIEGASDVKVALSDRRESKARVVGADPKTDIAVLKVEEKGLPTLTFADSSKVESGDIVLAIGDPFGIGKTVTMGIVSATGRGNLGIEDYEDFIQTDAAINPGNSGGALINTSGELVGINTAILSDGGRGNQGVGFAVPANLARTMMDQILKNGKVVRGYLGVIIQEVTPTVAKAFKLGQLRGALIGDVTNDGPAAQAGIVKGDIIVEINGELVTDSRELRLKISQMAPGTSIRLKLFRDGSERNISVKLAELPNQETRASIDSESSRALEGVNV